MKTWLSRIFRGLNSALGRGLTGVSAMASLAWLLWPVPQWQLNPEALAAFVIALSVWLASLAPAPIRHASSHDVELLKRFRALLSEGEKDFLRTYDLGGGFSWNRLTKTQEFAITWHGAEYEFDDVEVQEKFSSIVSSAGEFISRLSNGTWIVTSADRWASPIPETERDDQWSSKTEARIKDFNERATQLMADIDAFIIFARQKFDT